MPTPLYTVLLILDLTDMDMNVQMYHEENVAGTDIAALHLGLLTVASTTLHLARGVQRITQ